MTMQMKRAFNAKFMVKFKYKFKSAGSYDINNIFVEGTSSYQDLKGRIIVGNKFSQFDEGIAIQNEDGGTRTTDYISVFIKTNVNTMMVVGGTVEFKSKNYNILQCSDESHFGFKGFLCERVTRED